VVLERRKMMTLKKNLKIFIIAGEVSGDVLGAKIMREMPRVEFVGVGGKNMTDAGLNSLFPMSDLAVMGIVEVLAHAKTLKARIAQTIESILVEKPDIVLTIDSPGFAKSVVAGVRKRRLLHKTKFYHVVAPQVWAWGARRAKKYAKIFDRLYAFFDFEAPYFTKYGLDTVVVGHPIADGLEQYRPTGDNEKLIALVPGSRMSEVKRLLPIFQKTAEMLVRCGYKGYKFVIPVVETTDKYIRANIAKWKVKPELINASERYNAYINSYIAIVASGTVSAELAIMHIPTIVVYKMNPVTMVLARMVLRVKWVSLINILMNKTVFPELLGKNANPCAIVDSVQQLTLPSIRRDMLLDLKNADGKWKHDNQSAVRLIAENILSV